jgi:hypothetical protein
MSIEAQSAAALLEIVGEVKDRVWELEQQQMALATAHSLAPGTQPGERWTPCNREETAFYAALTKYA